MAAAWHIELRLLPVATPALHAMDHLWRQGKGGGLAHRATRRLRAGSVWVNTYQMVYPTVPYGGFKLSGHGKMLGAAFVEEMTQVKSVWMKVGA